MKMRLKNDLRTLTSFEPSWTNPIPDQKRSTWIQIFRMIEEVKDILYVRCSIPTDAVSTKVRILLLCDATIPRAYISGAVTCCLRRDC